MNGGADRDRTDDLYVANVALSQLSYSPINIVSPTAGTVAARRDYVRGLRRCQDMLRRGEGERYLPAVKNRWA